MELLLIFENKKREKAILYKEALATQTSRSGNQDSASNLTPLKYEVCLNIQVSGLN